MEEFTAMIELGPDGLSAAEVIAVARQGDRVSLGGEARRRMEASAAVVARLA